MPTTTKEHGMKVQIKLTIEVDPALWAEEYGCERSAVRDDVKDYFTQQVTSAPATEDAGVTVRVA